MQPLKMAAHVQKKDQKLFFMQVFPLTRIGFKANFLSLDEL